MTEHGHLKISRKSFQPDAAGGDPFWNEKRSYSRWEAWVYLLQAAAWADHKRSVGGHLVTIPRGHTPPLSLSFLVQAWGWSSKRVRIFLENLSAMERIRAVKGARTGTVYLIVNYDTYQTGGSQKGTDTPMQRAGSGQAEGTLRAGKRSSKAVKQESNTNDAPPGEGKKNGKVSLPSEWSPKESHREKCLELSVCCDEEAEAFRDYHMAHGNRMSDWDRAFSNWIRNSKRFLPRAAVNGHQPAEKVRTLQPGEVFR